MKPESEPGSTNPEDEYVLGGEEKHPSPEDTPQISKEELEKEREEKEALLKKVRDAKSFSELGDFVKEQGYDDLAEGIMDAKRGTYRLFGKMGGDKDRLKKAMESPWEEDKELFAWVDMHDEELNQELRSKLFELLRKEVENLVGDDGEE